MSTPEEEGVVEKLEVEDEDQRQTRIYETFRRLDSTRHGTQQLDSLLRRSESGQRIPESSPDLLNRVQAFLPQLAASNAELLRRAQEDPSTVDIENTETDEEIIEMNLGLGVFEQHGQAPGFTAYDADMPEEEDDSTSGSSSEELSDDDESDSESDGSEDAHTSTDPDSSAPQSELKNRPIKSLPRRKNRPEIVVVGGGTTTTEDGAS